MLNSETIKRYSDSFDAIKEKTKDGKLTVSKKNGDMLFWLVVFCAPIFGNHCLLGGGFNADRPQGRIVHVRVNKLVFTLNFTLIR